MKKLLILMVGVMMLGVGCEKNGTVNIDDCRESIVLNEDDPETYLHNFTCTIRKTTDGKLMKGFCSRVKLADDGTCLKSFTYQKAAYKCPESHKYLDWDGHCYEEWDTGRVSRDE